MTQPHIVIIGAGIIGLSTAYALLKQGIQHITILEQATVDHALSMSRGPSRLLRFEYGSDAFYSRMVQLSLMRWQELERLAQQTLYTRTGLLVLGNENDNVTLPGYHVLRKLGIASERLSQEMCGQRFPQFNTQNYDLFTYTAEAGLLHASTCLHILKHHILAMGGQLRENCRVTSWKTADNHGRLRLQLASGDECSADRLVLAAGPGIHHLLKEYHLPVRLTRQYLLYFKNVSSASFKLHTFPAFMADDLYGFPLHHTSTEYAPGWLKVASHAFGETVDPAEPPVIAQHAIALVTHQLSTLLPALRSAQLARIDSCIYDVSEDEDFILDYLPDDPRIVVATGFTGHGFKFGLLLGELLASLVCATAPTVPLERFSLARFSHAPQGRLEPVLRHHSPIPPTPGLSAMPFTGPPFYFKTTEDAPLARSLSTRASSAGK